MTEVSIIITSFNSIKFIRPCLDSVFSQDCQGFEVIVVDNGSMDGTVDFIRKNYPQVTLIDNKRNLGACTARNQGINVASGSWVLTLDCDVIIKAGFISGILKTIKGLPFNIGMIQPKILKSDGKTIYSAGIYLSPLARFYDIGSGKLDSGQFNSAKYVFGACSAAAVYKRRMLEDIKEGTGYFDERFFFLVEDVDLARRAKSAGWKAIFNPELVCHHFGNSSNSKRALRQYLCWRNRKFLLKKSGLNRFKSAAIFLLYDLPRFVFLYLTNPYIRKEVLNAGFGGVANL